MNRPYLNSAGVLYGVAMAAVIVGVDFVFFFRNRFWERLTVNIGIALVFAAFCFLEIPQAPMNTAR